MAASPRRRAPAFATAYCSARKPRGYWLDSGNVLREVREFRAQHGGDASVLPTAAELLHAGRADLYRAVQRQGGFALCARRIGLVPARHPRGYWASMLSAELRAFAHAHGDTPGRMPSTTALRLSGRTDILNAVQAAGGVRSAARSAGLCAVTRGGTMRRPRMDALPEFSRERHGWRDWPALCAEVRAFAEEKCAGRMPLQRELSAAGRHDLINAMRAHGGLLKVARRGGLAVARVENPRHPRGYWSPKVLAAEMRVYTAKRGLPGLMPRRDQLLRAGRRDLCYAVEKHGGFSAVSARLHLVWVGPSNYWRVFRNLRKRLLLFVRAHGPKGIMPNVLRLHQMGRTDLVYGIALHGGVMAVAKRVGLRVRYAKRKQGYWEQPKYVQKELEWFMQTQPRENRTSMPSSVALVQAGRADLANGVRDHGGWVYYAQRLGLRFAFERRVQGFWQNEDNVFKELMFYLSERYGDWEHPGVVRDDVSDIDERGNQKVYMPSMEMLKRDGRSDIAFAIQRYQGGELAFAERHNLTIAEDMVLVQPVETLKKWVIFSKEIEKWIRDYGADGIMPKREDFVRTGRHDLRRAMYFHGGSDVVAKRIGLVFCDKSSDWIANWLALQAGKLGTLLNFEEVASKSGRGSGKGLSQAVEKLDKSLRGDILGNADLVKKGMEIVSGKAIALKARRRRKKRKTKTDLKQIAAADKSMGELSEKYGRMSLTELNIIRERYKHLRSDDIIIP